MEDRRIFLKFSLINPDLNNAQVFLSIKYFGSAGDPYVTPDPEVIIQKIADIDGSIDESDWTLSGPEFRITDPKGQNIYVDVTSVVTEGINTFVLKTEVYGARYHYHSVNAEMVNRPSLIVVHP